MELLVVVALIGILSSVVYVSYNTLKVRARDNQRIADLNNINLAVKMYMQFNGEKPPYYNYNPSGFAWFGQVNGTCPALGNLSSKLMPDYMSRVPEDPKSPGVSGNPCAWQDDYWYYYAARRRFDGTRLVSGGIYDYAICANMERPSIVFSSPWSQTLNYCVGS